MAYHNRRPCVYVSLDYVAQLQQRLRSINNELASVYEELARLTAGPSTGTIPNPYGAGTSASRQPQPQPQAQPACADSEAPINANALFPTSKSSSEWLSLAPPSAAPPSAAPPATINAIPINAIPVNVVFPPRKKRRVWTAHLERIFTDVVNEMGGHQATPAVILERILQVDPSFTYQEVASHLQAYRSRNA